VSVPKTIVIFLDLGFHAQRKELVTALARLEALELELLEAISFIVAIDSYSSCLCL